MYAILRLPQLAQCRSTLIKSCQHHYRSTQCICLVPRNYTESKRSYNITPFKKSKLHNRSILNNFNRDLTRNISLSNRLLDKEPLKPSSKVEVTVQELKKKQEKHEVDPVPAKKSIKQKIIDELVHYYHGFRLLGIDIRIATGLVWRILRGKTLSRREYRLLTRTVGDMFRLVPFSVFIIVPFMEFLLPVFIKFFPGMLPSTFQSAKDKEDKLKQGLKVKLEMAKFLQGTLDDMSVQHKERYSQTAKEFNDWFTKVRTSGELVSNEDIMKFSKLFEDEITLDSLSRSQLIALCRVLEVQTLGTNNFLRFQLRMKLRSLAADDKMIQKEGVESLTLGEVQQACRARGMRAYGMSEDRLRAQLEQWLDLSLNEKVPPSLLLLSRALMLPETIPTGDKLKATISALPETIIKRTQASIGEKEGKIDNKVKIEILKEEVKKINEERLEQKEEKKMEEKKKEKIDKEILLDKAPILSATSTPILEDAASKISVERLDKAEKKEDHLQSKDFEIIEHAIDEVSKEKKFTVEKVEIQELKEEMKDYAEDVDDLKKVVASQPKPEVKETVAAKRLFKSVNKMINKLDTVLEDMAEKEKKLKQEIIQEELPSDKKKEELLRIDDIVNVIKKIKEVPDQSKIDQITKVLKKMDDDQDGSLKVDDVLKVIEIIGKENVKLSSKQIDELIDLLDKEEVLEVEKKIQKALEKEKSENIAKKTEKQKSEKEPLKKDAKNEASSSKNDTSSSKNGAPKQKLETQSSLVPPVTSIDKPSKDNNSKML